MRWRQLSRSAQYRKALRTTILPTLTAEQANMKLHTIYLLNRERIGCISGKDHAELLADLRALHLTILEALNI